MRSSGARDVHPLILLVTNRRDLTTDFIVLELQRRGAPYLRLNTEDLPRAAARFGFESRDDWSLTFDQKRIEGSNVRAAYFRRPGAPEIDPDVRDDGERAYCAGEWSAMLKNLYDRLEPRWMSTPSAIMLAEDKPRQLLAARELGFRTPQTVVTNSIADAAEFLAGPPAIGKPLREAQIDGAQAKVIFTSRIERLAQREAQAFAAAPMILQREVPKKADIRVTVVGARVFATLIASQTSEETTVDWRRGGSTDLAHAAFDLPTAISDRCRTLVQRLGLGFGAIDLVWGQDDEFWFLEINPNGQWAWIETRTGQPIAAAIVDTLERIADQ